MSNGHTLVHVHAVHSKMCSSYAGVDSLKEPVNSLYLPSERFSPVRRASDGLTLKSFQLAHLEKLYNTAISGSQSSSLKQLQHENQQLQVRVAVLTNDAICVRACFNGVYRSCLSSEGSEAVFRTWYI